MFAEAMIYQVSSNKATKNSSNTQHRSHDQTDFRRCRTVFSLYEGRKEAPLARKDTGQHSCKEQQLDASNPKQVAYIGGPVMFSTLEITTWHSEEKEQRNDDLRRSNQDKGRTPAIGSDQGTPHRKT